MNEKFKYIIFFLLIRRSYVYCILFSPSAASFSFSCHSSSACFLVANFSFVYFSINCIFGVFNRPLPFACRPHQMSSFHSSRHLTLSLHFNLAITSTKENKKNSSKMRKKNLSLSDDFPFSQNLMTHR